MVSWSKVFRLLIGLSQKIPVVYSYKHCYRKPTLLCWFKVNNLFIFKTFFSSLFFTINIYRLFINTSLNNVYLSMIYTSFCKIIVNISDINKISPIDKLILPFAGCPNAWLDDSPTYNSPKMVPQRLGLVRVA